MNTLIRTQISLPKDQRRAVDELLIQENISLAEAYRRAMEKYLQQQRQRRAERMTLANRLAGSLANSKTWKNVDASAWQRKLRREKGI